MRVLLADDQKDVRAALRLVIEQHPCFHVAGEVRTVTDLLRTVQQQTPDIILIDWELPGFRFADHLQHLRSICPKMVLVALSGQPASRQQALAAGADSFVCKADAPDKLLAMLEGLSEQET